MSDLFVFGAGSVIFVISTWATLSFGMAKMQELALKEVESSPRVNEVKQGQYTDVYLTQPLTTDARLEPELVR